MEGWWRLCRYHRHDDDDDDDLNDDGLVVVAADILLLCLDGETPNAASRARRRCSISNVTIFTL
jgi:hypothetical protein